MTQKKKQPHPKTRTDAAGTTGQRHSVAARAASQPHPLPWWLALGIITIIYTLLRVNSLGIPLDRDEGVFGYAGQRILEGGLPYLDVVDHKPPGVFYLYALALRFFSPTPQGVHWFLHTYNFLTLLAIWFLMKRRFSSDWAPFWGALCYAVFSASPPIQGFTASTEILMLLPIVISLLLVVETDIRPGVWLLLASGAAGAAAFWIKQTALTSVAFTGFYFATTSRKTDSARVGRLPLEALRRLLWWCAGGAIVTGLIAGYFKAAGIFSEFVYWSFTHNIVYAGQVSLSGNLSAWIQALGTIVREDFVVVGLGFVAVFWNLKRRKAESLFALGFLLFCLAGTLPGLSYAHYFAQIAPAVAVGSGWALSTVSESGAVRSRFAILAVSLALVLVPVWVHRDYFLESTPNRVSRHYFGLNPFPESAELSEYLASLRHRNGSLSLVRNLRFFLRRDARAPALLSWSIL